MWSPSSFKGPLEVIVNIVVISVKGEQSAQLCVLLQPFQLWIQDRNALISGFPKKYGKVKQAKRVEGVFKEMV